MKAAQAPIANTIPFSWVDGPGNRFVIFTQGCNLNCLGCHNPQTIPLHTPRSPEKTVAQLLQEIREAMPFITGVTVSGGEATLHTDFLVKLFTALHQTSEFEPLTRFIDSNGYTAIEQWQQLEQITDGVMLDLKALDDEKHQFLTGHSNALVLDSIRYLHEIDLLHEVRLLLIPGQNDSDEDLEATAKWLLAIDPEMKVRINAFKNHGVRASAKDWPNATPQDLFRYRTILATHGVSNLVSTSVTTNPGA
jgi:pyruvate-formate lyase-activating enzyme